VVHPSEPLQQGSRVLVDSGQGVYHERRQGFSWTSDLGLERLDGFLDAVGGVFKHRLHGEIESSAMVRGDGLVAWHADLAWWLAVAGTVGNGQIVVVWEETYALGYVVGWLIASKRTISPSRT